MWLSRYFPGLGLGVDDVERLTPEQTDAMRKAGEQFLKGEAEERIEHTKAIARAAGMRLL